MTPPGRPGDSFERLRGDQTSGAEELAAAAAEAASAALRFGWSRERVLAELELVRDAHPEMIPLANLLAAAPGMDPGDFRDAAAAMREAGAAAAAAAADLLSGAAVVATLSRSSTVLRAVEMARPERLIVLISEPGGEGRAAASAAADMGISVDLIPDSCAGHFASEVDVGLVGADAVLRDGSLVNKAGTSVLAAALRRLGRPLYSATSLWKVDVLGLWPGVREVGWDPGGVPPGVGTRAVLFDVTPSQHVGAYATERGVLDPGDVLGEARSSLPLPVRG